MRSLRRALCIVMAFLVVLFGALAEGDIPSDSNEGAVDSSSTPTPTPALTPAPTEAPTEAPEEAPTEAPAEVPTEAPMEAPTEAPAETPTEVPAESPMEVSTEAPAEASAEVSTDAPAEASVEVPTDAPAEASAEVPTDAPAEASVEVPTDAPTEAPAEAPTEASTEAPAEPPTEATTEAPAEAPTEIPTEAPTGEPTLEPAAEPTPEIETISVSVTAAQGITAEGSAFCIPSDGEYSLSFSWSYSGECDSFHITVSNVEGSVVEGSQAETDYVLWTSSMQEGSYRFTVEAVKDGVAVAQGEYTFSLAFAEGGPGGGGPGSGGPSGGGGSRGGSRSGSGGGAAAEQETGFRITPGDALTGSHTSGNKDMTLYGTVTLDLPETAMTQLCMGDAELGICLENGEQFFTAAIEGDRLILTPETTGKRWVLNGLSLGILARSGIASITLGTDDGSVDLPTAWQLQGRTYSQLCSKGYVSADYDYIITEESILVRIAGCLYRVDDSNELIPTEGDD